MEIYLSELKKSVVASMLESCGCSEKQINEIMKTDRLVGHFDQEFIDELFEILEKGETK